MEISATPILHNRLKTATTAIVAQIKRLKYAIPIVQQEACAVQPKKQASANNSILESSFTSILLVEDDPVTQRCHSAMLQDLGFRVEIAASGTEALANVMKLYDVILMDVNLPDMNGIELTSKIRALEIGFIPIIMLTSETSEQTKSKCLEAGANEFLTKPISLEKLNATLRHWLGIQKENHKDVWFVGF